MYEKIKDEIAQDFYLHNFPNDGQRFVAWYVHNIHGRDMIETKEDVTDGPDDRQIDAMVVDDDNSTVYVIQGKFISEGSVDAEPLREVLASWIRLKDIAHLQETGNQKLKRRLSEVATALEDEYSVAFELIVTGQLTKSAWTDLATFQKTLADADDFPAEIHVVNSDELQRRYDIALERENPLISHRLELDNGKYMAMEIGGNQLCHRGCPIERLYQVSGNQGRYALSEECTTVSRIK